ncbi:MAG TPA: ankyrin repeat domain-containing protein [Spirochaetota bacterium]|nr:ankyrin repeat domain-containing protein [Spirochaetota bacterium]
MRVGTIIAVIVISTIILITGCVSLYTAVEDNNVNQVKILLEKGTNPNESYSVHRAAWKGNYEIVKLLVDKGADLNVKYLNKGPLVYAVWGKNNEIIKLLLDKGTNTDSAIYQAVNESNINVIQMLLDKGADLNRNIDGMPLISQYAFKGEYKTSNAEFIVTRGANVIDAIDRLEQEMVNHPNETAKYQLAITRLNRLKSLNVKASKSKPKESENTIHLNDGSEIRGAIVNQSRTNITVKTKYTTMTIEKKNIKEIKYK